MNALFLEIDTDGTWAVASMGPALIGSFIRSHGHDVELLRVPPDRDIGDIIADVRDKAPGLVCMSIHTRQWPRARDIGVAVRESLGIPVIAGGIHPSFAPEPVLASGGFDFVCIGEGEAPVLDLLSVLESGESIPGRIQNLWAVGGARPTLRPAGDRETMPFMARDLLDERHGVIHVFTRVGCPFSCFHCSSASSNGAGGRRGFGKRRSVRNVMEEIGQIRRDDDLNYVIFTDGTFTADNGWVGEFCRVYEEAVGVGFSINARVDTVNPGMLETLAEAGCTHIAYGVESGSRRVRMEILNRPGGDRKYIEAFRWTKDAGILVTANYMLGLPGETPDDIERTLALNDALEPDDFGYSVFHPYPGTPLYRLCMKKGYLPDNHSDLPADNRRSILNLPDLSQHDIERYYHRFMDARQRA